MTLPIAAEVSAPPWLFVIIWAFKGSRYAPVIMITRAVIVQTTIVSINGSSKATVPSSTGWETLAAEWAIAADPIPASFENTALLIQSSKSQAEKEHIEEIYQDALKLEHENEKLIQESLQLKAELQLAENNTQIQRDSSSRNWFIVGAIVLFFGMVIGFILPSFFNRKRY